jgi:NAD+ kinase
MVLHRERPEARHIASSAAQWLRANGHDGWILEGEHTDSPDDDLVAGPIDGADLVLSLGGDGTMLRAVRSLAGAPVPLLGVNLGQLGYLTEVEPGDVVEALRRVALGSQEGRWTLDSRMMLDVEVRHPDGRMVGPLRVLNEVTVEKSTAGESIRLLLHIDGAPFTTFATDGLIVSTPTGSTAYALSARGPVISPRHRALLVTPVAPHQLFDRSLVLDPSETVEIEILEHRDASVVIDGVAVDAAPVGTRVACRPSEASARFVRFGPRPYHQILKAKFGLTDR